MPKRRVHYVLSTHWDREWHQSFQDFRYRLVQLIDRIVEGVDSGRLKGPFQSDGQAIVFEDYLEIRPEQRAKIEQLAKQRALVIGPWYAMPDELLVSGESLVRNLRLGRQIARDLGGEPSCAGFICDMFGHNSQLPQIFAGLGIKGAFLWRGLNETERCNLIWRGADGTELPSFRFGYKGYCTYGCQVRKADKPGQPFNADQMRTDLKAFLEQAAERSEVDPILMFDGGDHMEWDQQAYEVLCRQMEADDPGFEIIHTCLDDYLAEMLDQTDRITTTVDGELREPGRYPQEKDGQWVIPGVLSSRVWIKQSNAYCQAMLCHWAEPASAFASEAVGCEYPQGFLDVAWKWLIKNHPHDSICGCSIDLVHEDMKFRFSQCGQIADRLTTEATKRIAAAIEQPPSEDNELRVVVFNPLPQPVDSINDLTLQIPTDWPQFNEFFGFEPKPAFRVFDAQGREIAYQRIRQEMSRAKVRLCDTRFPQGYNTHDVTVSLPLTIPAMGYTTLTVRAGDAEEPTRHPEVPGMATSERSMANEFLDVTVKPNGSLTLTDRETGQIYGRLLTFEDVADIGDGWYHGVAVNDQAFVSTACPSQVALVNDGPMLTTFRVRTVMSVPVEFEFDRMVRSESLTELVIDSYISLRRGSRHLEVESTVQNTARDHRLRVLMPSGAKADTYLADSPFDVVERPIALREDNHLYRELEVETKPQQSWTAVSDADRGLGVVDQGLLETAVRDLPDRTLALTLMRATRRTAFTDGEPEGQLQGNLSFRYWIVPLAGEPDRARLCSLGVQLAAAARPVQLRPKDIESHGTDHALPTTAGFMQVDGPVAVTSTRAAGEAVELRMFNPNTQTVEATLDLNARPGSMPKPTTAQPVDLESNPKGNAIPVSQGKCTVSLSPKEIVTLRLE